MKRIMTFLIILILLSIWSKNLIAQSNPEEMIKEAKELFYVKNKKDQAVVLLKEASDIYKKNVDVRIWLGIFYYNLGQFDKAIKSNDQALAMNPKLIGVLLYKARSCYRLKKYKSMEDCLIKAIQIEPNDVDVYYNIIQLHFITGQYEKVLQEVSQYKKLDGTEDLILVYGLMTEVLLRQFNNVDLPPSEWKPTYNPLPDLTIETQASPWLKQLCTSNTNSPDGVLGTNNYESISGKRYKFGGTKENPFEYANGAFFIWDATVILDNHYGILISNGSKIKYISVINNVEVIKYGTVKNWLFVWD